MADDNTQVDGGQVDNSNDDGQTDDNDIDITKQSDGDFMEDTVDFIKEAQKIELGEDDSGDGDSDSNDSGIISELSGTGIPDDFSDAAEAAGMSKEDIIALADKHTDEQLIEMIPHLEAALKDTDDDKGKDDTRQDDKQTKDGDDKTKDIDPKLIESVTEKISKQLEEKFGTTLDEINKFKANQEEQSNKQTLDRASKILDEASKEFPVFGKTDELPKWPSGRLKGQLIMTSPEMKARLEVLRYADAFIGQGADIDNAMDSALATYKGLHLEKELERKQIRDLKNHETKLSGARVGRETKKKHVDTRDEIIDEIRQMQRAAGVD